MQDTLILVFNALTFESTSSMKADWFHSENIMPRYASEKFVKGICKE